MCFAQKFVNPTACAAWFTAWFIYSVSSSNFQVSHFYDEEYFQRLRGKTHQSIIIFFFIDAKVFYFAFFTVWQKKQLM